ncbi:MAG: hypothetical protein ACR2MO_10985 [Acidimicrobiales bacterium]
MTASLGILVAATLVWLSGSDMFFGYLLLVVPLGWVVVAAYLIIATVVDWRRGDSARPGLIASAAGVLALIAAVGVGFSGVAESVRIAASRDALTSAGQAVLAGGHPARAGLYGFEATSISEGCAILTSGTVFIGEFGWAYCPAGTPASSRFEYVGGALYTYTVD